MAYCVVERHPDGGPWDRINPRIRSNAGEKKFSSENLISLPPWKPLRNVQTEHNGPIRRVLAERHTASDNLPSSAVLAAREREVSEARQAEKEAKLADFRAALDTRVRAREDEKRKRVAREANEKERKTQEAIEKAAISVYREVPEMSLYFAHTPHHPLPHALFQPVVGARPGTHAQGVIDYVAGSVLDHEVHKLLVVNQRARAALAQHSHTPGAPPIEAWASPDSGCDGESGPIDASMSRDDSRRSQSMDRDTSACYASEDDASEFGPRGALPAKSPHEIDMRPPTRGRQRVQRMQEQEPVQPSRIRFAEPPQQPGPAQREITSSNARESDLYARSDGVIPDSLKQLRSKEEEQRVFQMRRKYLMEMERDKIRRIQKAKQEAERVQKIKKHKEDLRIEEERLVNLHQKQAMKRDEEVKREAAERARAATARAAELADAAKKKETENLRYVEALRMRVIEKIDQKNLSLPPLCHCGLAFWANHPDNCANNCVFYKNPELYCRTLADLLASLEVI